MSSGAFDDFPARCASGLSAGCNGSSRSPSSHAPAVPSAPSQRPMDRRGDRVAGRDVVLAGRKAARRQGLVAAMGRAVDCGGGRPDAIAHRWIINGEFALGGSLSARTNSPTGRFQDDTTCAWRSGFCEPSRNRPAWRGPGDVRPHWHAITCAVGVSPPPTEFVNISPLYYCGAVIVFASSQYSITEQERRRACGRRDRRIQRRSASSAATLSISDAGIHVIRPPTC